MSRPTLLLLPAMLGCVQADVAGSWTGDCAVTSMGVDETYALELELEAGDDGGLTGTGLLDDGTAAFALTAVGEVQGRKVSLTLDPEVVVTATGETLDVSYGIEAKAKGEQLVGDCIVGAMGINVRGALTLDRP